uniref:Uncharacterized protein n=1 Tax=Rousettus aegyptiacus TaxID=9407 RepID=A0A7J8H0X1_ROUAE|nr:hypothetical protein HJG63_011317 [Rousettus aegyptiacus]
MAKWSLFQECKGWSNIRKCILSYLNAKEKKMTITSTDAEKATENSTLFMIKSLRKLGIKGDFLNFIKNILCCCCCCFFNLQLTLYLMVKKINASPLRLKRIEGFPLSPLLFNMELEVLANATKQKRKCIYIRGRIKLAIYR